MRHPCRFGSSQSLSTFQASLALRNFSSQKPFFRIFPFASGKRGPGVHPPPRVLVLPVPLDVYCSRACSRTRSRYNDGFSPWRSCFSNWTHAILRPNCSDNKACRDEAQGWWWRMYGESCWGPTSSANSRFGEVRSQITDVHKRNQDLNYLCWV